MSADLYGREVKRRKQGDVASSSISSSSFLSLKAELAKHQSGSTSSTSSSRPISDDTGASSASSSRQRDEYSLLSSSTSQRRGEADESSLLSGSFSKPTRKLPAHLRPSPSTTLRAAKDSSHSFSSSSSSGTRNRKKAEGGSYTLSSWSSTPSAQLERDRNLVLERKARLYDQLKRGLSGGLSEEDLRDEGRLGGLVNWERKVEEGGSGTESESGSDEGGEHGEGEEMVEFQDELGRTRRLPRSQMPMAQLIEMKRREEEKEAANIPLLHGPQHHFPILTTANSSSASSAPQHLDENAPPPEQHFDASAEVRNRGAGFYRFTAGNEEERRRQMAGLREERERTLRERERTLRERERRERGGEELKEDGEPMEAATPGLRPGGEAIKLTKGERRLAERRELIEARRRELALAKQRSSAQDEGATSGIAVHTGTDGGKPTTNHKESAAGSEEERRQREREQRAIDHFLDEVDEEYRSRQT